MRRIPRWRRPRAVFRLRTTPSYRRSLQTCRRPIARGAGASILVGLPRPVVYVDVVQESGVPWLPAEQPHGLAGIDVLAQGEGVGDVAHRLAGLRKRQRADRPLVTSGTCRRRGHLEHREAGPVADVEDLAREAALRGAHVRVGQVVDVNHGPTGALISCDRGRISGARPGEPLGREPPPPPRSPPPAGGRPPHPPGPPPPPPPHRGA